MKKIEKKNGSRGWEGFDTLVKRAVKEHGFAYVYSKLCELQEGGCKRG